MRSGTAGRDADDLGEPGTANARSPANWARVARPSPATPALPRLRCWSLASGRAAPASWTTSSPTSTSDGPAATVPSAPTSVHCKPDHSSSLPGRPQRAGSRMDHHPPRQPHRRTSPRAEVRACPLPATGRPHPPRPLLRRHTHPPPRRTTSPMAQRHSRRRPAQTAQLRRRVPARPTCRHRRLDPALELRRRGRTHQPDQRCSNAKCSAALDSTSCANASSWHDRQQPDHRT